MESILRKLGHLNWMADNAGLIIFIFIVLCFAVVYLFMKMKEHERRMNEDRNFTFREQDARGTTNIAIIEPKEVHLHTDGSRKANLKLQTASSSRPMLNDGERRFCENCGTAIGAHCGNVIPEGRDKCSECGGPEKASQEKAPQKKVESIFEIPDWREYSD